jgi:hypothetical protein
MKCRGHNVWRTNYMTTNPESLIWYLCERARSKSWRELELKSKIYATKHRNQRGGKGTSSSCCTEGNLHTISKVKNYCAKHCTTLLPFCLSTWHVVKYTLDVHDLELTYARWTSRNTTHLHTQKYFYTSNIIQRIHSPFKNYLLSLL